MGCMIAWPAPTLTKLRQPDSPVHLNIYQEGLIVSALYLGKILSPLPSGTIMNIVGPKRSILIMGVFPLLSWILVFFSTTSNMLVAARFLAGFWPGVVQTLVPIYMAEISEPHVRGTFGSFFLLSDYLGETLALTVAPLVSVRAMAVFCGAILVLNLVVFSLCPESPYFYAMRGDAESAAKSLAWFRGGASMQTNLELELIQISIEKEAKDGGNTFFQKLTTLVTVPANRKALTIVGVMAMMDKLSGIRVMTGFSYLILPRNLGLTTDDCNIIFSLVCMASMLLVLGTGLTNKVGRKPLLYMSSIGIGLSMFTIGAWYLLNSRPYYDVSQLSWVLLAGYLVFGCTYSTGLGFISPILQGEMFPSKLKGPASALSAIICGLSSLATTLLFPVVTEKYGVYTNFFAFSAIGFGTLLFTFFYVIETEGKTLQTIQSELSNENIDQLKEVGESNKLLGTKKSHESYV